MADEKDTPVGPNPDGPGRRVGPPDASDSAAEDSMADEDREGQAPDEARTRTIDEALQNVQQAAQAARQATQQAEQAVQAAQQAARGVGAETSGATVETVISPQGRDAAWGANLKGQFDRFQSLDLEAMGSRRASDGHMRRLEVLAEKALENCLSASKQVDAQIQRHADIAQSAGMRALGRLLAGEPEDVVDAD